MQIGFGCKGSKVSHIAWLVNHRRRIAIVVGGIAVIGLSVIANSFRPLSQPDVTPSGLVKATPIDPDRIPKRGIPAQELTKYKAKAGIIDSQTPHAAESPNKGRNGDHPEFPAPVNNAKVQEHTKPVPFEKKPAVIAAHFYAPAKVPASMSTKYPPETQPMPVPIEKIIKQRQRLAKGEVLHVVGVIKKPPLMQKTRAEADKQNAQRNKFQQWWQKNNGVAN